MDKPSSSGPTSRSRPRRKAGRKPGTKLITSDVVYANGHTGVFDIPRKAGRLANLAKARAAVARRKANGDLTPKQQMFVNEYMIDLNVERAARRAGYKATRALWRMPQVQAALAQARAKMTLRAQLTAERVLHELAAIGFCNIGDLLQDNGQPKPISQLTRAQTAAISEITIETVMQGRGEDAVPMTRTKFRLMDKRQALVDLGKHMGMFVERKEFGRPGDFAALDSKKLEQALYDEYLALGVSAAKARALVEAASGPEGGEGEGEPGE